MRLRALSGFGAKGPACFLLETGGARLLLDLGEGPDAGALPDLSGAGRIDAILISHGHCDHVGGLALAAGLGDPPVHATAPTRALSRDPALRGAGDLPLAGRRVIAGVPVETGRAGHAPGAVWMRIGGEGGLLYTGDMSRDSTLYPFDPPPPARALLLDASYGDADAPLADQVARIRRAAQAGPVLLPAPAAGRGLEMAVRFLAEGFAVALCPAHRAVAGTLLAHPAALAPGAAAALRELLAGSAALDADAPARGVMIATGPNAESGVAAALLPRFLRTGEARVIFTGHLAEGAPAIGAVAAGRADFLRWNVHPRLGEIRALLAAVQPAHVMPVFTPAAGRAALARALPFPLSDVSEITWTSRSSPHPSFSCAMARPG